jgi:hypothetical protein
MKRLYTSAFITLICLPAFAQTPFWTEDFGTGCDQGQSITAYSGPNGSWTMTDATSLNNAANKFYVSATEANTGENNCGDGCGINGSLTDRTLHVAGVYVEYMGFPIVDADLGASYNAGGLQSVGFQSATDIRAESPMIDCSGKANVTLRFLYMEGGQGSIDNATLMANYGSGWVLVADLAKTPTDCAPQGRWTAYEVALPSADGQANVQIGFHWVNNDDGAGADPSFAVDDLEVFEDMTTGITSLSKANGISVTNDHGQLELTLSDIHEQIEVVNGFDMLGQQVFSRPMNANHARLDLSAYCGMLVLQVEASNGTFTRKLVLN